MEDLELYEVTTAKPGLVNMVLGIIYRVKLLGEHSLNGRRYARGGMQMATPKYEGCDVYCNHATGPGARDVRDKIGKIRRPYYEDGAIYGDVQLILSHPMAATVLEAAQNAPDMFGMSHNVRGKTRKDGRGVVVEEITAVVSVDIVSDPATTRGLFESVQHDSRTMLERWTDTPPKLSAAELKETIRRWSTP